MQVVWVPSPIPTGADAALVRRRGRGRPGSVLCEVWSTLRRRCGDHGRPPCRRRALSASASSFLFSLSTSRSGSRAQRLPSGPRGGKSRIEEGGGARFGSPGKTPTERR